MAEQRAWIVTVSWPASGRDLDLFTTVSSGGQTTSGIGWNNGSQTSVIEVSSGGINGTFYAKWGGDNTGWAGSETFTVYFSGTLPAGHTQIATVTPHCNYYGEGSGAATVTVDNQNGSWTVDNPSTRYGHRAEASDPSVNVPLYADGGTPTPFPNLVTVTLNANGGTVSPNKLYYIDPISSTKYGTIPTPTKDGGIFVGWYTSPTGGTLVDANSNLASLSSHTLYAHWMYHVQVVTFKGLGRVSLNGSPGDDIPDPHTVAEGDFYLGDSITIAVTPLDPTFHPFKAWYRDPYAWGNPEQTGTLVSGAGATYTTTVTTSVTYFATFDDLGVSVSVETMIGRSYTPAEDAVVSINGQSDGDNAFTLIVLKNSSVVLSATAYGGTGAFGRDVYFVGWFKYDDMNTMLSDSLNYTVQAPAETELYPYVAKYDYFFTLNVGIRPDASSGSVSLSPASRYGNNLYQVNTNVTMTATPSAGYRFKHWIRKSGETEEIISNVNVTTITVTRLTTTNIEYIAVFEWDGTDLLVNSSNLGSPVKLVYDDTSGGTGKLIADY